MCNGQTLHVATRIRHSSVCSGSDASGRMVAKQEVTRDGLPRGLERRRPRHPSPERSQSRKEAKAEKKPKQKRSQSRVYEAAMLQSSGRTLSFSLPATAQNGSPPSMRLRTGSAIAKTTMQIRPQDSACDMLRRLQEVMMVVPVD